MEENKETNKVPTTVDAVKQPKLDQLEEYNDLVKVYLEKAAEIFGKKTHAVELLKKLPNKFGIRQ